MKKLILVLASLNAFAGGPFSPPASVTGTTAISKDSPMITSWAVNGHVEFSGYLNIENKQLGFVSFGDIENTFGYSNGSTWSLGDSGVVVLEFSEYISDNEGFDFAVFENSFSETFLELAFVEVSSDGINFFRFPSTSLTDSSSNVGTFGNLDATNLNNLAGKYSGGYGTPFDLAELPDTSLLNKQAVQYVKIIDVIGTNSVYGSFDSNGNKIIDPFPTPFNSGGFDLEAVAVLGSGTSMNDLVLNNLMPHPNPTSSTLNINLEGVKVLYDLSGQQLLCTKDSSIDISNFPKGTYFICCQSLKFKIIKI